jgi:hypothetical protein
MADRQLDQYFSAPVKKQESAPAASAVPASPATPVSAPVSRPIHDTSQATDDQRKIVQELNAPSTIPSSPAVDRINNILGTGSTAGGNGAGNVTGNDSDKPWYERGSMPPSSLQIAPYSAAALNSLVANPSKINLEPNNPEFKEAKENLNDQRNLRNAHQEQKVNLQSQHDALHQEHQENVNRYNNAFAEHTYANSVTPESLYRKYLEEQQVGKPPGISLSPDVELKRAPIGGLGTYEYSIKSGATPAEAMDVPSMSSMQKQNIPTQNRAVEAVGKMFPGMNVNYYEGYPFLLAGQTGEEYLKEKFRPEHQVKTEQERQEEENKKMKEQIQDRLAEHKAQSKVELEKAEREMRESGERLRDIRKQMNSSQSPVEMRQEEIREKNIGKLEEKIAKMRGSFRPSIRGAGFDEYTNLYPGAGDMSYAHELELGIANPNLDKGSKAVFLDELNKLQKRNPLVMPALKKYYGQ